MQKRNLSSWLHAPVNSHWSDQYRLFQRITFIYPCSHRIEKSNKIDASSPFSDLVVRKAHGQNFGKLSTCSAITWKTCKKKKYLPLSSFAVKKTLTRQCFWIECFWCRGWLAKRAYNNIKGILKATLDFVRRSPIPANMLYCSSLPLQSKQYIYVRLCLKNHEDIVIIGRVVCFWFSCFALYCLWRRPMWEEHQSNMIYGSVFNEWFLMYQFFAHLTALELPEMLSVASFAGIVQVLC